MPRSVGTALRILFGLLGTLFLVLAFRDAWDRTRGSALPSWQSLVVASVLVTLGLISAAESWRCLFSATHSRAGLARGFYASQLGKYVPGAIWQPVSLVAMTARSGVPLGQASAAFPVHAIVQVAAGGTIAATLAIIPVGISPGVRLGALAGIASPLILRRRWIARGVRLVERVTGRDAGHLIPPHPATIRSYLWCIATIVTGGAGFAVLAADLGIEPAGAALSAFAAAWTAGFVAVPFPSGIGVREVILIGILGAGGVAPVIAGSVAHRIVTIAIEGLMIVASLLFFGRARRPAAESDLLPDDPGGG